MSESRDEAHDGTADGLELDGLELDRPSRRVSYMPLQDQQVVANPFVNLTSDPPCSERAKRIFVGLILLPLRVLFTVIVALLAVAISKVVTCGLTEADYHPLKGEPLARWRLVLRDVLLYPLVRFQLFLMGFIYIKVKGKCASQSEAPIIVCNHVSGLIEGFMFWDKAKLAESSYVTNPILGPVMVATSCIFVDRCDAKSRQDAKDALLRRGSELGRWPQTLVFPEGTCTNGTSLVQFKQGAFAPGVAVQPVVVRYPFKRHDPSFTFPLTVPTYLLGLMLQFVNWMEVEYLPVYVPTADEVEKPSLFAANVQQVMAKALGVPSTKHASEDVSLCMEAMKLSMPAETGTVQWQQISEQLTGVKVNHAKVLMKQFHDLVGDGSGQIDCAQFISGMRGTTPGPLSEADLTSLFQVLDTSGDGYLNFVEYMCGVAVLNGHGRQEDEASYKLVFDCLAHGQSHFTKTQLVDLLHRVLPTLSSARLDELFQEADLDRNGVVSRDEFIAFAIAHKQDLNLSARGFFDSTPMARRLDSTETEMTKTWTV